MQASEGHGGHVPPCSKHKSNGKASPKRVLGGRLRHYVPQYKYGDIAVGWTDMRSGHNRAGEELPHGRGALMRNGSNGWSLASKALAIFQLEPVFSRRGSRGVTIRDIVGGFTGGEAFSA